MVTSLFKKTPTTKSNEDLYKEMLEMESTLLGKYSGLQLSKDIEIFNVPITLNGKEEFIHTTRCGSDEKEDLVLIHGYLVGQMSFYRMMKKLSEHYRLWCIDLVGMGASSRPEFTCTKTEETIDYFVDMIEQWRQAVGIERFHLAGQSFGGYMSTMYSLRYPEHVKKLILLTPAGVSRADVDFVRSERINELSWLKRQAAKQISKFWERKTTPHVVYEKAGVFRKLILKVYVKRAKMSGEEFQMGYRYLDNILNLPESTLKALHLVLAFPQASAFIPLEDKFRELKMPCEIYFGQKDWINTEGAYRAKERGDFQGDIHIIPKAGHAMNFENPNYLADLMIKHKRIEEPQIVFEACADRKLGETFEIQTEKCVLVE